MPDAFDREFWEDRYRGRSTIHRHPNPQLVAEVADLPPGRALDAGCGEGGDALWLAARGWHVTAVDIAETALDRARAHAATAGADVANRIEWVRADLSEWTPPRGGYDLVSSHYVHAPGPREELLRRLAGAVAPGGTLLVVGHDHPVHPHPGDHTAPESRVTTSELAAGLKPDLWEGVVAESRTHTVNGHDGQEFVMHDAVLRAVRRP
ncbi:class I SAM-dependent methyltransferase [Rhodococcus sp. NPDC003382]|uniref:class I SAM-dependent methyltransferase n=1 Tax=unclassified Rhodococcus (in: high G+C Gram-positive bacteria) TaxID=192944 RepID=UPI0018CEE765|nr:MULTISPECIES: class I SAM-dependent methyltransferase [unclassified Rhodococcus (in: high G+C Gram-positive bacteria)]MBH0120192.1 class I SAM-dependent methyltransferase [Rhodococcus sp. CX]MCK8673306.1 methyltransferase domain-containing protein [Rhodococcus sp. HM1]